MKLTKLAASATALLTAVVLTACSGGGGASGNFPEPRSTDRLRTGAAASSSDVRRGGLRRCLDEGVTIWRTLLSVMFRVPPRWRSVGAAGVVRPRLVRAGR